MGSRDNIVYPREKEVGVSRPFFGNFNVCDLTSLNF